MKWLAAWFLVLMATSCSRVGNHGVAESHNFDSNKPDAKIDAFGGELLGFDHGEWGGKLVFRKNGKITDILNENVKAIVPMEQGILVFTGLSHLGTNEGYIYTLVQAGNSFSVVGLQKLDGSPDWIRPLPHRESVVFRVFTGKEDMRTMPSQSIYQCKIIDRSFNIRPSVCESIR